jgi:uncharacterized protein (DUF2235 family)
LQIGSGLGIHIKDAYQFIMQNYIEGDRICLLGFSRGAYTVRCLAGMLHKVGLLPAYNTAQVNFAYQFYKNDTSEGWEMSEQFKRTFCQDVTVYFVGIWDCVASVSAFNLTPFNHFAVRTQEGSKKLTPKLTGRIHSSSTTLQQVPYQRSELFSPRHGP